MVFDNELKFEEALIKMLTNHGWEKEILKNPTEEDLHIYGYSRNSTHW